MNQERKERWYQSLKFQVVWGCIFELLNIEIYNCTIHFSRLSVSPWSLFFLWSHHFFSPTELKRRCCETLCNIIFFFAFIFFSKILVTQMVNKKSVLWELCLSKRFHLAVSSECTWIFWVIGWDLEGPVASEWIFQVMTWFFSSWLEKSHGR